MKQLGLSIAFEPSVANAETMAKELPLDFGPKVLPGTQGHGN